MTQTIRPGGATLLAVVIVFGMGLSACVSGTYWQRIGNAHMVRTRLQPGDYVEMVLESGERVEGVFAGRDTLRCRIRTIDPLSRESLVVSVPIDSVQAVRTQRTAWRVHPAVEVLLVAGVVYGIMVFVVLSRLGAMLS